MKMSFFARLSGIMSGGNVDGIDVNVEEAMYIAIQVIES